MDGWLSGAVSSTVHGFKGAPSWVEGEADPVQNWDKAGNVCGAWCPSTEHGHKAQKETVVDIRQADGSIGLAGNGAVFGAVGGGK